MALHEEDDDGGEQDNNDDQENEPPMAVRVSSGQQGHCLESGGYHDRPPSGSLGSEVPAP